MRRAAWGLLVLIAGCGRCRSGGGDVIPIREDPAKPDAARDAEPDPATAIPAEWQGTYVLAVVSGPDAAVLAPVEIRRVEIDARGPGAIGRVLVSQDPVPGLALAPDGATLAFTTQSSTGTGSHDQALSVVPLGGGAPKELARCGYECSLMGFGADGEVWYVNRESGSLVGEVQHVPSKGGAAVKWPNSFSDCYLSGVTSDDGMALLLGVDNSLGWPECIALGRQGFFIVPIADPAKRDTLPKRIDCFTTHKATDINIQISGMEFTGPDRVLLTLSDGWDTLADAPSDAPSTWSCRRDGTDPQLVRSLAPLLAPLTAPDGKQWLAVTLPGDTDFDHAILRLLRLDGWLQTTAFRKR